MIAVPVPCSAVRCAVPCYCNAIAIAMQCHGAKGHYRGGSKRGFHRECISTGSKQAEASAHKPGAGAKLAPLPALKNNHEHK